MSIERRKATRHNHTIITIIKKIFDGTKIEINEFMTQNISTTGAFIISENTDVLEVGDTYDGVIDIESKQFSLPVKIVRKMKIQNHDVITENGFGITFINPSEELINEINLFIKNNS